MSRKERQLRDMLKRLTEKVERANQLQHSRATVEKPGELDFEDWSELHQLTNEARGILDISFTGPR